MKKFLILIILFFNFQTIEALSLKDKFRNANPGDYIISEQNKSYSLIRVHAIDKNTLTLEELSFPYKELRIGKTAIETWLKEGAIGHTSWHLLEIDLNSNKILECFSFTRNAWLIFKEDDSFLIKLFSRPLHVLPNDKRKKIGPAPLNGPDLRRIWNPPLISNGKKIKSPSFEPYVVHFPRDNSPLSGKRLEIYFDKQNPEFPFPYWAQVTDDSNAAYKIRICDSGTNLFSPVKEMPRRPPVFSKSIERTSESIKIFLQIPSYYKDFKLHAIDQDASNPKAIRLPFQIFKTNDNFEFRISKDVLKHLLEKDHTYTVSISSESPISLLIETKEIL